MKKIAPFKTCPAFETGVEIGEVIGAVVEKIQNGDDDDGVGELGSVSRNN